MKGGDLSGIPAVILAGGFGTRLRSVIGEIPKPLALVEGRPFIEYLLTQLKSAGIARVVISTGYRAELIENLLGSSWNGLSLSYCRETEPLGTGGALALSASTIAEEVFLALNGDSYCACDLPAFVQFHRERGAYASIALSEVPDASRYGTVAIDVSGRITAFREKTPGASGLINGGIYLLRRSLFEGMSGQNLSLEKDLFPRWITKGLYGFKGVSGGTFIDIGTPETFASAGKVLGRLEPS